jgi:hypothetical protein
MSGGDPERRAALERLVVECERDERSSIGRPKTSPFIAYVMAKSGDTSAARQRLLTQDVKHPQAGFAETRRAYTYLGLGDTANALSALERATNDKEIWAVTSSYLDPILDPIRASPRFQTILRQVGLGPVSSAHCGSAHHALPSR